MVRREITIWQDIFFKTKNIFAFLTASSRYKKVSYIKNEKNVDKTIFLLYPIKAT